MKLKCAILDDYQKTALDFANWSSIEDQVEVTAFHQHFHTENQIVDKIKDFDIVIIMRERTPFNAAMFGRLPKLKLLVTTGMRNASIDLTAAKKCGVTVCGTSSGSEPPTELAWGLILNLARHITEEHNNFRQKGSWQLSVGEDLYGKCFGIIGLGKIGTKMATIAQAFGMDVVAWSENLTTEKTDSLGVRKAASLAELLRQSDYVSIHLVLSDRTRNLITSNELKEMKPSAFLINTSRAPIINQRDLIEALENEVLAGAGLDVYEEEPLSENHPFRTLPNVLATPHLGYVTRSNYEKYYGEALEDIRAYLLGSPIRTLI
ncbi:D-2-hydroxyacid dehydrogenase family protein [Rummeliibacillus stabekisii]|uniref:D-2-hydroxyacid dehydrogenase family protein n=1 Tax=Rummeliibacillus stabekisii TaxID=241244 RepID=UPI002040C998|nr:D-2-hydroxyacid dehydrogenase family protein [Rummeliibacillus stabekisii]MCM3316090.1 D-2-hydroxyacid dehydrogenase family protein [Rummeliibacillus stabekisii]